MGTTDLARVAADLGFPPDEHPTLDAICERARHLRQCFEAKFSDATYARMALRECATDPAPPPYETVEEPRMRWPSNLPKKIEDL